MKATILPHLCSAAVLASSAISANAITVANSVDGLTVPDATSDGTTGVALTTTSFDMSGGNAVALLFTAEGIGNNSALPTATFAGQAMSIVTAQDSGAGAQTASIFYILNPVTTVGAFEVTVDAGLSGLQIAYSQISLSGVSAVSDTDTSESTSSSTSTPLNVSYTTSSVNGYVLGAAVNNDFSGNGATLAIDTGNPDTDLLSHTLVGSSGHFHTYGDVPTSGLQTDGYLGQYQRTAVAAVAFVPEPSVALLSGLGVLALVGRRRRL